MSLTRRLRLGSVAGGSLLLFGCVTRTVEFPPEPRRPVETPRRPVEPPRGPVEPPRATAEPVRGQIAARPGRAGLVVAAPHGSSDMLTGEIATEVARRTGFGLVVATGFDLEPETREASGRRYQVNRPFEGTPGRPPAEDTATDAARRVYESYEQRVRAVAQGPLRFYAEIHGNNRRESSGRIEIATVGVDREYALRLRVLCELIRDAHLRVHAGAPRLEVAVEPADPVFYVASGAKREGILKLPERALHIELPRAARVEFREAYTAILADFVGQAASLPRGR
jgi:hypothetical protein